MQKSITPYLFFQGNCRDAIHFYRKCFGGNLELTTYSEAPGKSYSDDMKDKVMHAYLKDDEFSLMASDMPPDQEIEKGNKIQLSVESSTIEELEELFRKLSENGTVVMPLEDAFWGSRFGIVIDQFGIHWMLSCPLGK